MALEGKDALQEVFLNASQISATGRNVRVRIVWKDEFGNWKNRQTDWKNLLTWLNSVATPPVAVTAVSGANSVVATPNPITASGTLQLDGDAAAPGNSKYYGTDLVGAKGFHAFPTPAPALPYKSYAATIQQNNFSNPIPGIQSSTFTNTMTWARTGSGTFTLTNGGGEFTAGKTWVQISPIRVVAGDPLSFYGWDYLFTSANVITFFSYVLFINAGNIEKAVTDATNSSPASVEVRVYP